MNSFKKYSTLVGLCPCATRTRGSADTIVNLLLGTVYCSPVPLVIARDFQTIFRFLLQQLHLLQMNYSKHILYVLLVVNVTHEIRARVYPFHF
jgi:hypothetical protein